MLRIVEEVLLLLLNGSKLQHGAPMRNKGVKKGNGSLSVVFPLRSLRGDIDSGW